MNTPTTVQPEPPINSQLLAPADKPTLPMYWSVRRELWENRSVYVVPLVVAAFVLFGSLIGMIGLPRKMRTLPANDPAKQHVVVVGHVSMAPVPIILATFLVGIVYSLGALHGERRDRSILFWKSLPVSDRTTVLSKASIPLVVLPLLGFAIGLVTQQIVFMLSTAVLLGSGSAATLWTEIRFFQEPLVMLYGLIVHALWFAPIYCWLLLVSAWARRTPVLWAALPWVAVSVVERVAFSTSYFGNLMRYRVTGAMTEAFAVQPKGPGHGIIDQLTQLDPGRFLNAPGLWVGLAFAAVCLAAAVRLRRNREPI
jgi:ABC-2 type transport system permease protein